jgi:hypothetical protein
LKKRPEKMDPLALGRAHVLAAKFRRMDRTDCGALRLGPRLLSEATPGRQSAPCVLRALAFKWIRILWRCWHDQKPYDEPRYLASLRRHGSTFTPALQKIA